MNLDPAAFDRLRRIGGDTLVKRMVITFLDYVPGRLQVMEEAVAQEAWKTAGDAAHAVKSSAGNIGASALMDLAMATEKAGRGEDAEAVVDLVPKLRACFEELRDELERHYGQEESP